MIDFKLKDIWKLIKVYKEGLIIGAATGFIAAHYLASQGQDLTTLIESGKGLIETVLPRAAPLEVAQYKLYGAFTTIGATLGLLTDMLIDQLKLRKR